jgi:hypothetical protein
MEAESAAVFLRSEASFASVNAVLIHVDKINGFCVAAQKFCIPSVAAGKLQRRAEIFILDDGPDDLFPLNRYDLFGASKIEPGSVSVSTLRHGYPTNNFIDGVSDGSRRRIGSEALQLGSGTFFDIALKERNRARFRYEVMMIHQ